MPQMTTPALRLAALLSLAVAGGLPAQAQPQNPAQPEAHQPGTPAAAPTPAPATPPAATPSADGPGSAERSQRMDKPGKSGGNDKAAEPDVVNDTTLVMACKQKALGILKNRSPSVEDIFIDMDGLTVAQADTMVGNTKVIGVMMGEAYIQRDKTDKVHRFLCLTGEGGKVLMTFFTER